MTSRGLLWVVLCISAGVLGAIAVGCKREMSGDRHPLDAASAASHGNNPIAESGDLRIKEWHFVDNLQCDMAQFDSVFWEPEDTTSLRTWIRQSPAIPGSSILEIGTGTGLIAITCLGAGARKVVATDINPAAFANAQYNFELWRKENAPADNPQLDLRLVSKDRPEPFAVVEGQERFDLIVSNPPWEDRPVTEDAAYALYDPGFNLLDGILEQAQSYLRKDGRLLLAYGAKAAIERVVSRAPELNWQVEIADDRNLETLPEVFVPGVLLILTPR